MAGFLLIHGAMHGGWCFDEVAAILRGRGHTVVAPDLPGMGGDEETLRGVTLAGWTEFALAELKRLRTAVGDAPVVLAGHSRGGLNISAAAEADPAAMDAIVYITAMMVPPGVSGFGLIELTPPNPDMEDLKARRDDASGKFLIDRETAIRAFAQISPRDKAEAAMSRLVAEPMGPLAEPIALTAERWGSVPRTYIECTQDATLSIAQQRKMQELSPGAKAVTLDSDHSPFLCMPEALADALEEAAG